jgi:Ca-activated chloride channel family protein
MSEKVLSRTVSACTAILLLLLVPGYAQEPQAEPKPAEQPHPNIRVQVNEVIVPVTVTDDRGKFVSNLEQSDFRIFDEGKLQKIRYFTRDQKQPVVIGFILDMSNQTRLHWKTYQDAMEEMVLNLMPGDKKFSGYLLSAGNTAELLVDTTDDPEKLVDKIRKMKPGGGVALYDAIYKACMTRHLIQGEPYDPRRVLIILGDGNDNASKKSLEEVLEIAQRQLVTIYALSTVAYGFHSEGDDALVRLVEKTGGRVEYPLNSLYKDVSGYLSTPSDEGNYAYKVGTGGYASEISNGIYHSVGNIAGEITTQYILRYIPDTPPSEKQFRKIKVEIANLPNVKIRAREGYYPFNP